MSDLAVLPVRLPSGDPDGVRAVARSLGQRSATFRETGVRLRVLLGGVLSARWRGQAATDAQARLGGLALLLQTWAQACGTAEAALRSYAAELEHALALGRQARALLDEARSAQQRADAVDPSAAVGRSLAWSGGAGSSYYGDPAAAELLQRARRAAFAADELASAAVRRLVAAMSLVSGRTVTRGSLSPRILVDLAGWLPVVGDAVDAVNGAVYLWQGRWWDGGLSLAGAVPGPLGWLATGGRLGRGLEDADKIVITAAKTDDEVLEIVRSAASPLQVRHISSELTGLYRDRQRLLAMARASADQSDRRLLTAARQLDRKYKHGAALFDLPAGGNPRTWRDFDVAMRGFVSAPTTVKMVGTYHSEHAVFFADTVDMRRFVMTRPDGQHWSGWLLEPGQAHNLWNRHAL